LEGVKMPEIIYRRKSNSKDPKYLKHFRKDGQVLMIELTDYELEAVNKEAMKIEKDMNGSEVLVVTMQINPEWQNDWQGNKKYIKDERGKLKTLDKFIPLKMLQMDDEKRNEVQNIKANEAEWRERIREGE
jgi:hypothetical protein